MATVQNTRIVVNDITITANIKPDLVNELSEYSKAAGRSLSWILNKAIHNFIDQVEWDYTNEKTSCRLSFQAERKQRRAKIRRATTARETTARPPKTEMRPTVTNTETPLATSDEQFAADVWVKALTGELLAAGRSLVDDEDKDDEDHCMIQGLIAMYKDHELSQQRQVDAAIEYLDPSASE